ncbi:MAG: hypothetical protein HOP12_11260, partial [Candidatus Eisenbacteria bacterium]|nr:hypothetical protein [Candidatus Eisenbacteria bacterium]
ARMRLADAAQVPELARAVVGAGADLHQLSVARKSLEAWFLEVMGHDQRPG